MGIILVLCGSSLLFWNEGRAIKTSRALEEGLREITIPETIESVFVENNEKLVLVGGHLAIRNSLHEDTYGVSIHSVKLKKIVEVYQWKETEHKKKRKVRNSNGHHVTRVDKSYTYSKGWFDYHIDSASFHRNYGHNNPPKSFLPAESRIETSNDVKIGGFVFGPSLKNLMTNFKPLSSEELPVSAWVWVKLHDGMYYHTKNLRDPEIGEYRVQLLYAGREGEAFTVVGKQSGQDLVPYNTRAGEELFILRAGLKEAGEVFLTEHHQNMTWTWIYRLLGWLATFLGLCCLGALLEQLLDLLPSVRSVVTLGLTSLPFSVSISLTLTIIGVGWSVYRPIVGLALLVMGLLPYMAPLSTLILPDGRADNRD